MIAAIGVGSIVAALITARKDSDLQLREKMLGAADDFITASSAAIAELRALDPTVRKYSLPLLKRWVVGEVSDRRSLTVDNLDSAIVERVQGAVDKTSMELARVELMFSPFTRAARKAKQSTEKLNESWDALRLVYVLSRAPKSETAEQRLKAIERAFQDLGELGIAVAYSAMPALESSLSSLRALIIWKAWERVEKRLANLDQALEEARTDAISALAEASDALMEFASSAGSQALAPRLYKKRRYTVTTEEQIVFTLVPRSGLSRRIRELF